jgi:pyruvate,orthophosphate dikinase
MPGMMDTVLNLGLNDAVVEGLAAKAGERFAYDSYRRFLDMFGAVVMGLPHETFEAELESLKEARGVAEDTDLSAQDLRELVESYKGVYSTRGVAFPQEPLEQLRAGIYAVFDSWMSERAGVYRRINGITGLKGTAVNVQAMAYGNLGDTSGTGVCFTRNPSTGEALLYGEYLINAQGEDVVAGIRTPEPIARLAADLPEAYAELVANCNLLEAHYKDMQDIEFTVQARPMSLCLLSFSSSSTRRSFANSRRFLLPYWYLYRRADCLCCSVVAASAPARVQCGSRWTWSPRGS